MKEVEWGEFYGEGEIVCTCDNEGCCEEERIEFDENFPDYQMAQKEIEELGWVSSNINGKQKDFCSEACRRKYLEKNC